MRSDICSPNLLRAAGEAGRSPTALSSLCVSHRTEDKKSLSPRTLPRRPYKVLLATLTDLYQQLDQSESPRRGGAGKRRGPSASSWGARGELDLPRGGPRCEDFVSTRVWARRVDVPVVCAGVGRTCPCRGLKLFLLGIFQSVLALVCGEQG